MADEEIVLSIDRYEQLIQYERTAQLMLDLLRRKAKTYSPITYEEVRVIADLLWLLPDESFKAVSE